jgi:hypothetical protein
MDNRPPNYQFLERLADMFHVDLILPPKEKLGYYMKPGSSVELGDWLLDQEADIYIISVEMLVYGGLIASREKGVNIEECHKRMRRIALLKNKHPGSKIFLSSIVRRASISTHSQETQQQWNTVNDYFTALGRKENKKASKISRKLPKDFLDQYKSLRKRNHEINKESVDLTHKGIVDTLVLAQEDTFRDGPQKEELKILTEKSGSLLSKRIFIHNGADEVCQELLVRAIKEPLETKLKICYDSPKTAEKVMDFEDRPFKENVSSHLKLCNFVEDSLAEKSLVVSGTETELTLKHLDKEFARYKNVGLVDVINPNGGTIQLINSVGLERLSSLYVYSAWNTASNSLGTALAVMSLERPDLFEEKARLRFLIERYLDDYLYQGVLRDTLETELRKTGGDVFHVSKTPKIFKNFKKHYIKEANEKLLEPLFKGNLIPYKAKIAKFELPWDRTFECEIQIELNATKS